MGCHGCGTPELSGVAAQLTSLILMQTFAVFAAAAVGMIVLLAVVSQGRATPDELYESDSAQKAEM